MQKAKEKKNMKRISIIFTFLLILSIVFSQSEQKTESEQLYKIHKRVVEHEKNIGKDTSFYKILDTFKLELDAYVSEFGHDEVFFNIGFYWGKAYASIDPHASIEFLKKNISYAEKDENKYAIATNQHELGKIYYELNHVENAVSCYLQTGEMFKELEDWPAYAYCIIDIANVYFYKGQYSIANSYYDKAYIIFKEKLDKEGFYYGAALCHINKGLVDEFQSNYESALENYRIALNFKKKNKKENLISSEYLYIANVFEKLNNDDSALFYYNLAVKIDEKYQMINELFYSYLGLGNYYLRKKDFKNAKEIYYKAYNQSLKHNQLFCLTKATIALGDYFREISELDSAIYYYENSYNISLKNNIINENKNACEKLYNIHTKLNNTQSQLTYLERLYELAKNNNNDNIAKIQVQYEFNERLRERELAEIDSKRLTLFIWGISVITILIGAFAFMVFRQRLKLKQVNIQLEDENQKIETQSKNLEAANSELKKRDEFKEGLINIIVHDLKNPANSILHLTDLIDNKDETQVLIKQSANQILNLVHNILDVQKHESVKMQLNKTESNIRKIADSSIKQAEYLIKEKKLNIQNNFPNDLNLHIDNSIIERVFTNLLTNAITFTPNNGKITFGYDTIKSHFFVKDSGQGIDKDLQKYIFDKFSQVIAKKSGKALSTGLGITYCKQAIEAHGGAIWVESKLNHGSCFFFTLPKIKH